MIEYKLKTPIVLGEETIKVLKLDEAKGSSLKLFEVSFGEEILSSVEGLMRIINACSTNTTESHINEMRGRDIRLCGEVCLTNFFL